MAQLNAFSVDVEDHFQGAALAPAISVDSWPTREYRVEANTKVILKLCAEETFTAPSLFWAGWPDFFEN